MVGAGIELPPSNDFSFYDQMLDMAVLVDAVPARYRSGLRDTTDQYFAMARGVQAEGVDLAALHRSPSASARPSRWSLPRASSTSKSVSHAQRSANYASRARSSSAGIAGPSVSRNQ